MPAAGQVWPWAQGSAGRLLPCPCLPALGPQCWRLLCCSSQTPLSAPGLLLRARSVDPAPFWAAFQSPEECPVLLPGRAARGLPGRGPNGSLFKASSDILITNRGQPSLSGPQALRGLSWGCLVVGRQDETRQKAGRSPKNEAEVDRSRAWASTHPPPSQPADPHWAWRCCGREGDQLPDPPHEAPMVLSALPTVPPATSSRLLSSSARPGAVGPPWGGGPPGIRAGRAQGRKPPPALGEQRGSRSFHAPGWLRSGCWPSGRRPGACPMAQRVTALGGCRGQRLSCPAWLLDQECLGGGRGCSKWAQRPPNAPHQTCFLGPSPLWCWC